MKIYPCITTTKDNWRDNFLQITKLKLQEVCLFPTGLDYKKRKQLYKILENSTIKTIPLVHVRHDFRSSELDYFIKNYNTRFFNIHPQKSGDHIIENSLSSYKKKYILLENNSYLLRDELDDYLGICLDFAHLENNRLKNRTVYFNEFIKELKDFPVKAAHLGAIYPDESLGWNGKSYDSHYFDNLKRLDYVKRYKEFLPEVVSLELENTIEEQLEAINYLKQNIF